MKTIILFLCFFCSFQFAKAQHLISYQFVHHYTKQDVQAILNSFGVPPGIVSVEYDIDYYKVTYSTRNAQDTGTTIATGAVVVPSGVTCPAPIISYQHGTVAHRYEVPSYRGGSEFKVGLIASALTGAVTSMPDYLGLGDSPGLHPYVHANSEASATIDLLRTVRELKDSIGYNLNDQLFLFGYSQGGHATMAAFKEIETNLPTEFTVTACTPMSGPYDVAGVQAATITADTSYATPGYLPYVIMGYQEAYGNLYTSLSDIFRSPYDTLLPGYFDGTHGMGWINNQLPDTPNVILDSAYFQLVKNDPNHFFWGILKSNNLYNWVPQAPLEMYYCTEDEQVFYKNSLVARDSMHALGATHVVANDMGALNHSDCAPLCFLAGLTLFDLYLDFSGGMTVSSTVMDASTGSSSDGSIDLTANSGVGPYIYDWSGSLAGQTTAMVTGLAANNYDVKVTDSRGCYVNDNIVVSTATSFETVPNPNDYFRLMPNPAQDMVYLRLQTAFSSSYDISIIDMLGQTVHQTLNTDLPFIRYNVSMLPAGTYLVRLQHEKEVYTQKLLIQR